MRILLPFFIVLSFLISACNVEVNKSIDLADGEKHRGDITTVNGSITTGKDCTITGDCSAINGMISIGDGSQVKSLQTVNGPIEVGLKVIVKGDIDAINGGINVESGSQIFGDIGMINGRIDISNTIVKRDLSIKNGDIFIRDGSTVEGDILVETEGLIDTEGSKRRTVTIRVTDGSQVLGGIEVGDTGIQTVLYLKSGGKVHGEIRNAEVVEE